MRRDCLHLFPLILILLFFSTLSYGQAWSGVLAPSRAIDWSKAGLPASYPNGDTTPNGWTPPDASWTQCGSTLSPIGGGADDTTQINNALAVCTANHYVFLGPGTFSIQSQLSHVYSYIALRGSGPMQTILTESGSGWVTLGGGYGGGYGRASSGLSAGSTSITITGATATPVANNMGWLTQCDTGTSGNPCSGTPVDNNGIFVCGLNPVCDQGSGTTGNGAHEKQMFFITSVVNNGGGSYTLNFSNPIYGPTWSTGQTAIFGWYQQSLLVIGSGFENFTVYKPQSDSQAALYLNQSYGCWARGIRIIGQGQTLGVENNKQSLVTDNYIFGLDPKALATGGSFNEDNVVMEMGNGSDDLLMNNIVTGGVWLEGEG